jgi:hypothetical protein
MDMAIQRDKTNDRNAALDLVIEQFRAAEKRALVRRGVELWTRAEAERVMAPLRPLGPHKIN